MEKEQLLAEVRLASANQTVSKTELIQAYDSGLSPDQKKIEEQGRFKITSAKALQYVGGLIVFLGIVLLIGTNWQYFNEIEKVLLTFGVSLIFFGYAIWLDKKEGSENKTLSTVFHLLAAIILPLGIYFVFDAMGFTLANDTQVLAYEATLLVMYSLFWLASKKEYYSIPVVIVLTDIFFTLTNIIYPDHSNKFSEYRVLIIAGTYLLLGKYYSNIQKSGLAKLWSAIGALGLLVVTLVLGGFKPTDADSILWEIIYPFLIIGAIYFSVHIKSSRLLGLSAIFLVIYIIKITSEYFSESLSWPIAVVLAGLLIMAVGYVSVMINKRYIKEPQNTAL